MTLILNISAIVNYYRYEHYPNFYRAGNIDSGFWTTPKFDCDGLVKKWLITYAAPFFGWDSLKVNLEFK